MKGKEIKKEEKQKSRLHDRVGYMIYSFSTRVAENEKAYLLMTAVMSFFCIYMIVCKWTMHSMLEFCYAAVFFVAVLAITILFTKYVMAAIFAFIAKQFEPLAEKYCSSCMDSIENISVEGKSISVGEGAKVNLKYFISLEKNMNVYNAKYIGPI